MLWHRKLTERQQATHGFSSPEHPGQKDKGISNTALSKHRCLCKHQETSGILRAFDEFWCCVERERWKQSSVLWSLSPSLLHSLPSLSKKSFGLNQHLLLKQFLEWSGDQRVSQTSEGQRVKHYLQDNSGNHFTCFSLFSVSYQHTVFQKLCDVCEIEADLLQKGQTLAVWCQAREEQICQMHNDGTPYQFLVLFGNMEFGIIF